jgi:ATP-binding cassette subfamily B protein
VLRPLTFGANAAFQSVVIGPSLNVLVLSRLFRWTLGQDITFFDTTSPAASRRRRCRPAAR